MPDDVRNRNNANGSRIPFNDATLMAVKPMLRRSELRRIVPLSDTTIYEMEQRGEFPRRFYLTSRCVVWDVGEVQAWIEARRAASHDLLAKAKFPDVRRRKVRPVKTG